jgi:hypothetical protein
VPPRWSWPVIGELLAPLAQRRGVRVVALGVTGSGKSYALRHLVAAARSQIDVVYVVDDSEDGDRWGGQRRVDIADCAARPLVSRAEGGSNLVVLTGDVFARRQVDAEAVARDAWAQAAAGNTAAVAFDELRRAAGSPQRWAVPGGDVPRLWTEGRKVGLSAFAATNFPQEVPREALGQSDLLIFALDGKEILYLERSRLISPELAREVARLQMHKFVVRRLGGLTDRSVYRL